MAIHRVEKKRSYTKVDNRYLMNPRLSYTAKGLLTQMLSVPEEWEFSLKGLEAIANSGREAITTAIKDLQENGYLEVIPRRDKKGRFRSDFEVYEDPSLNPSRPEYKGGSKSPGKKHKTHKEQAQQTQFNDFAQREYDYTELEKKFLGR